MPLPYRWLTALMTRCEGSNLLIDCGEGTQIALKEKGWSPKPIDYICFTHYHADHISGLPGLLLTRGNAERTEPLTLIGPKGSVQTKQGLIVAQRHIHMTLADADRLGVKNGDIVDIKVEGPRGGVMTNVAIRANDSSALECHIDTEEANAMGLTSKSTITIVK